jgi:hypothetical protein
MIALVALQAVSKPRATYGSTAVVKSDVRTRCQVKSERRHTKPERRNYRKAVGDGGRALEELESDRQRTNNGRFLQCLKLARIQTRRWEKSKEARYQAVLPTPHGCIVFMSSLSAAKIRGLCFMDPSELLLGQVTLCRKVCSTR